MGGMGGCACGWRARRFCCESLVGVLIFLSWGGGLYVYIYSSSWMCFFGELFCTLTLSLSVWGRRPCLLDHNQPTSHTNQSITNTPHTHRQVRGGLGGGGGSTGSTQARAAKKHKGGAGGGPGGGWGEVFVGLVDDDEEVCVVGVFYCVFCWGGGVGVEDE